MWCRPQPCNKICTSNRTSKRPLAFCQLSIQDDQHSVCFALLSRTQSRFWITRLDQDLTAASQYTKARHSRPEHFTGSGRQMAKHVH